jgi:hypothetical protein
MPWYGWVFDGVGAAVVVPLFGWVITRFQRKKSAHTANADATRQPATPQPTASSPAPSSASPAPSSASGPTHPPGVPHRPLVVPSAGHQPGSGPADLIDLLLAVPDMTDPAFRQRLYERLPRDVAQQLHLESRAARLELAGLIDTFAEYPHLSPWRALLDRLKQLQPAHQSVPLLGAELARRGLV